MMRDHLLRFDDERAAKAALFEHGVENDWPNDFLPVTLVTADTVLSSPDKDGAVSIVADREVLPGFWLLTTLNGQVAEAATIERATGVIVAGDISFAGARLDPVWAGAEPVLSIGDPEA